MAKTQSTQSTQPPALEFGTDTVYVRANIVRKNGDKVQSGRARPDYWEYDESAYTYAEWAKQTNDAILDNQMALVELAQIITGGG